jgi:hypothetical protein
MSTGPNDAPNMSAFSVQKRTLSAFHVQIRGLPRVRGEHFELARCVIAKALFVNGLSVILLGSSRRHPDFDGQARRCRQYRAVSVINESPEFQRSPPTNHGTGKHYTENNDRRTCRRRAIGHQLLKYWTQITDVDTLRSVGRRCVAACHAIDHKYRTRIVDSVA